MSLCPLVLVRRLRERLAPSWGSTRRRPLLVITKNAPGPAPPKQSERRLLKLAVPPYRTGCGPGTIGAADGWPIVGSRVREVKGCLPAQRPISTRTTIAAAKATRYTLKAVTERR